MDRYARHASFVAFGVLLLLVVWWCALHAASADAASARSAHVLTREEAGAARVYLVTDTPQWMGGVQRELDALSVPHELWDVSALRDSVDMSRAPPPGVFFVRLSPSAHARGVLYSMEFGELLIHWLQLHDRPLVNSLSALRAESSKALQDMLLRAHGLPTPHTRIATGGAADVLAAVRAFALDLAAGGGQGAGSAASSADSADLARNLSRPLPPAAARELQLGFLVKPSRGGTGQGVRFFASEQDCATFLHSAVYQPPVDGVTLVQQFVRSRDSLVYRLEFVQQVYRYALRIRAADPLAAGATTGDNGRGGAATIAPQASARMLLLLPVQRDGANQGGTLVEQARANALAGGDGEGQGSPGCDGDDGQAADAPGVSMTGNCPHADLPTSPSDPGLVNRGQPAGDATQRFAVAKGFWHPIIPRLAQFLRAIGSDTAGIEIVLDAHDRPFVIDANVMTSTYNEVAEAQAGLGPDERGNSALARLLQRRLAAYRERAAAGPRLF